MMRFTPKTSKQISHPMGDEVHVWRLQLTADVQHGGQTTLTSMELEKINRLRSAKHREYAMAMRVQLRQLLSVYLGIKAGDIVFEYAEFGKPFVPGSLWSFNVSHSGEHALVAISQCKEMGVDIECWRDLEHLAGLVERNFSTAEKQQWSHLNTEKQAPAFFDLWTCKEGFIKATGRGLGMGVSRCSFDLDEPHEVTECPAEYGAALEWRCVTLEVGERISASLVMRAASCEPVIRTFDPENLPTMQQCL